MVRNRPISGWILIVVGVLISSYSQIVIRTVENVQVLAMQLFTYIGLLLLFVGVVKVIYKSFKEGFLRNILKKEKQIAEKLSGIDEIEHSKRNFKVNASSSYNNSSQNHNSNNPNIIFCQSCGAKSYSTSNFCHVCGSRLQK